MLKGDTSERCSGLNGNSVDEESAAIAAARIDAAHVSKRLRHKRARQQAERHGEAHQVAVRTMRQTAMHACRASTG